MVCIFLCLYFLVLVPNLFGSDGWKAFRARLLGAIGRFALFSLLAGGLASVLLIPEIAALHATEFSEFNFPEKINWYFSFFDVIARHATGVSRETGLDHWPNIFCSSAVFFLIPLYIVNRKIPLKGKARQTGIMHLFHRQLLGQYPEFHLARFQLPGFASGTSVLLYILLVLLMCYEAFSKLDGFTMRELFVSLACGLGYLCWQESSWRTTPLPRAPLC